MFCGWNRREGIFVSLKSRTTEHSKENIPRSKKEAIRKHFFTRIAKYLKDNIHNSLNFSLKYTRTVYIYLDIIHSTKITSKLELTPNYWKSLLTGSFPQFSRVRVFDHPVPNPHREFPMSSITKGKEIDATTDSLTSAARWSGFYWNLFLSLSCIHHH